MGRQIYTYQPIDLKPDVAIGISMPFGKAASGMQYNQNYASGSVGGDSIFSLTYTTDEQLLSNLTNLITTLKGERPMQPDFGTDIPRLLFEPNNPELHGRVSIEIKRAINFWLPYVEIIDINVGTVLGQETSLSTSTLRLRVRVQAARPGSEIELTYTATPSGVIPAEVDLGPGVAQGPGTITPVSPEIAGY